MGKIPTRIMHEKSTFKAYIFNEKTEEYAFCSAINFVHPICCIVMFFLMIAHRHISVVF